MKKMIRAVALVSAMSLLNVTFAQVVDKDGNGESEARIREWIASTPNAQLFVSPKIEQRRAIEALAREYQSVPEPENYYNGPSYLRVTTARDAQGGLLVVNHVENCAKGACEGMASREILGYHPYYFTDAAKAQAFKTAAERLEKSSPLVWTRFAGESDVIIVAAKGGYRARLLAVGSPLWRDEAIYAVRFPTGADARVFIDRVNRGELIDA